MAGKARLARIELPEFGMPTVQPEVPRATYARRLEALLARMAAAGLDALVVYGDREHAANVAWLTGYDPRFEETLCIVRPGHRPTLLVGNEGWAYAAVARLDVEVRLWQPLSLLAQPRDRVRPLPDLLREAGLDRGQRLGVAGWKYDVADPAWLEVPHWLVTALAGFATPRNAGDLFMDAGTGLRIVNDADQLAAFEFAACHTSTAVRDAIRALRPGMSELALSRAMGLTGLPSSVHLVLTSGERTALGLASPSGRVIGEGDPLAVAYGVWGALNCRAGFAVADAAGLPEAIRDYVERLVAPYFACVAEWYETLGLGVPGGVLHDLVQRHIGDPFFGVGLNPGHSIHLDEWVNSPVLPGSTVAFPSGAAVQCDIIPATGTPWFTTNIEDGVALADAPLREELAARYPEAWGRIEARRAFMREALGIRLRPEVLPFSNIAGWLPPFLLDPGRAMTVA
ncbi:MAG: aminopeptidase P family N-terminal domain-containing protein [Geminicoccaceae bacterium]